MRLDKASQHVITRWRHPRASMCTSRLVCTFIFVATIATTINAILLHPILSELTIDNLLPPNTPNRIHDPHAANYQNSYNHKYHCHVPILNHQLIAVITTLMATKSAKVWLISKSARQGLRLAASSRFLSSLKICNCIFFIFIIQMFHPYF